MNFNFFSNRKKYSKCSYSQCGEDLIIQYIFNTIGTQKPTYWDIGAFHPYNISNTALFYEQGSRGVNIEPNPYFFNLFKKERNRDININAGISFENGEGTYYQFDAPTLNSFSEECIKQNIENGHRLVGTLRIPLLTAYKVSEEYFNGLWPDFLTIDVEGLDAEILNTLEYDKAGLVVICVEIISYSTLGRGVKNTELIKFLESKGYLLYADTYLNGIFVKKNYWYR